MKKMLSALITVCCLVVTAHAYTAYDVVCNFHDPHLTASVTTDFVEYQVTIKEGGSLADFFVGYGVAPIADSMYIALTSRGADIGGWTQGADGTRPFDPFTPDGSISGNSIVGASLHWSNCSLGEGVYYFGYLVNAGTYLLVDTGWVCDANTESWAAALSSGTGPVHTIVVPEPSALVLAGLGACLLALRRRRA